MAVIMMHPAATSIDADEVARFAALADEWWDPHGGLAALHQLNPVRIAYIRDHLARHFGRDPLAERPLAGLRLLDIGCGAGLLCEPMARLGAEVIGVDAARAAIDVALRHAADGDLHIDYRHASAETLVDAGESFDAVLVMEVIEHVADLDVFFAATCALLRPGGMIVAATLNRTPQAFTWILWLSLISISTFCGGCRSASRREAWVCGVWATHALCARIKTHRVRHNVLVLCIIWVSYTVEGRKRLTENIVHVGNGVCVGPWNTFASLVIRYFVGLYSPTPLMSNPSSIPPSSWKDSLKAL